MSTPLSMKKIVIATHNNGKLAEFKHFLSPYVPQIFSLHDFPELKDKEIPETGSTFQENALIKAQTIFQHLNIPTLADDSGLCVVALNHQPGIYSRRYAGENSSDEENNIKLLNELHEIKDRRAYFVCGLALILSSEKIIYIEEKVDGVILDQPRGKNGFGYDPLFALPECNMKTMSELSHEKKLTLSHRGKALCSLIKKL